MLIEIGKDISVEEAIKVANSQLDDSDDKDEVIKKLKNINNKEEVNQKIGKSRKNSV